ncbi:MAG: hybrid sensor histidine kinase/response regulator [Chthoniobacterales bacterium]|nr:hybrid sensor histidine kinase/response regulator [Chthoniobacterales bacterium]
MLDDTPSSAQLVRIILEANLNCKVSVFYTADALYAADTGAPPDLYFLDIVLQKESGIQVCKRIRQDPLRRDVPVIFLSAHGNPEIRVQALQVGGIDYIDKPFYPAELVVRTKAHLQIADANHRYREQLAQKQNLLRILCHDLRNPISAAYSALDVLQQGYDPTAVSSALESCRSALELIDDIARKTFNFTVSNKIQEKVELRESLETSALMLLAQAQRKKIQILVEVNEDLTLNIERIPFIHNVINNLLSNSIKFSYPESKIYLEAKKDFFEGVLCVIISVKDEGIGMPKQMVDSILAGSRVFSRSGTLSEQGTGSGLQIVRRFVEQYNGKIEIISTEALKAEDQHGTEIRLIFPLEGYAR